MSQLQQKCKDAGLQTKGLKHHLVQRLYEAGVESTPPTECKFHVNNVPNTIKEIRNLTTAQIKTFLRNHGFTIIGNRDELILRLYLVGKGYHHLVFYNEMKEIRNTIKDAEQLVLEERQDYLKNPGDIYRKRTHCTQQVKILVPNDSQIDLGNLHKMFEKLKNFVGITMEVNKDKGKKFLKEENIASSFCTPSKTNLEAFFEIGTKVKVKWSASEIKDTGWKPGWYVAYVHSADSNEDQIVIEHPSEPDTLCTLDVSPMIADGSLKLIEKNNV